MRGLSGLPGVSQEDHAEHRHGVLAGGQLGVGAELVGGLPEAGFDLFNVLKGVPCHQYYAYRSVFPY
jgi:hypothetical protein